MRTDPDWPDREPVDAASIGDVGLLSPATAPTAPDASDAIVIGALVAAEAALMRSLVAVGAAPDEIAGIADRLEADADDIDPVSLAVAGITGGNPVIPIVRILRARAAAIDPDAVPWVHLGATSQDIMDTALMIVGRDAARRIVADLDRIADALVPLAREHRDDVCVARTLTQHAVPTTIGARIAGWLRAVVGARRQLAATVTSLPAQLGGAAGTLSAIVDVIGEDAAAALPAAFAEEVGLAAPASPWHTDRRPVTDLGHALATTVAALGTMASDLTTLSRTEIAEVLITAVGGSSTMPQKRNPIVAVLIRSAAMRSPGAIAQLHLSAGTAVDERPDGAWHAEWPALRDLVQLAEGAAFHGAALALGLEFDTERARANLELTGGLVLAERLGGILRPRIGDQRFEAIIDAAQRGEDLRGLIAALPDTEELDVDDLLDPSRATGLTGPIVDAAIADAADRGTPAGTDGA